MGICYTNQKITQQQYQKHKNHKKIETQNSIISQKKSKSNYAENSIKKQQVQHLIKNQDNQKDADDLFLKGYSLIEKQNYPQALKYFENWLKQLQSQSNQKQIARVLNVIGKIQCNLSNQNSAYQALAKSYELTQKHYSKKSNMFASVLKNMSLFNKWQQKFQQCFQLLHQSIQIWQQIPDQQKDIKQYSQALCSLAEIYFQIDNYESSLLYYKKSLQIQQKILGKDSIQACKTKNNIGMILYSLKNYDQALRLYLECLQTLRKLNDEKNIELMGRVYHNLSGVYYCKLKLEDAINCSKRAYDIFVRIFGPQDQSTKMTNQAYQKYLYEQKNLKNMKQFMQKNKDEKVLIL